MPGDARALLATVSDRIVQQPVDALQLKQQIASLHLTTGIDEIDRSLRGGIAARSLTEVVGPAGAGKTQFAMMMACRALAQNAVSEHDPEGRPQPGVVYIDTEGAFSAQRAWQITQQLAPAAAHDRLISRIRVFRVTSSEELMALLGQLESIIIEENVKLITLDSAARGARDMAAQGGYLNPPGVVLCNYIPSMWLFWVPSSTLEPPGLKSGSPPGAAALVRKEFGRDTLVDRQLLLGKQAAILKRLAEVFDIPVIVTNQV